MTTRTNPFGGRVRKTPESELVAVVNISNVDQQFNDCEPPFPLHVLQAGNIDAGDDRLNCIQLFTKKTADKALLQCGPAILFLTEKSGGRLMAEAQRLGSFEAAMKALKDKLGVEMIDLMKTPTYIAQRNGLIRALAKAGVHATQIDDKLTNLQLHELHRQKSLGRQHLQILDIEEDADQGKGPAQVGGRRRMSLSPIDLAREEITSLGGEWHPAHDVDQLNEQLATLRSTKTNVA